jgi:hypothetical protein
MSPLVGMHYKYWPNSRHDEIYEAKYTIEGNNNYQPLLRLWGGGSQLIWIFLLYCTNTGWTQFVIDS